MKKMVCVSFALLCAATSVFSQNLSWGIVPGFNSATQLVRNPSKPEDGTFQFNSLAAWGLDGYVEKQLFKNVNAMVRAGYQQKGFTWQIQTFNSANEFVRYEPEDRFHYINLDAIARLHLNKEEFNPFIIAGFRADYLIKKDLDNFLLLTGGGYEDYSTYNKFDAGLVAGIGAELRNTVSLAIETNLDLLRPVKTDNTAVRNWVFSATLGINISEIL